MPLNTQLRQAVSRTLLQWITEGSQAFLHSSAILYTSSRQNMQETTGNVTKCLLRIMGCSCVCSMACRLLWVHWGINRSQIVNNTNSHAPATCEQLAFKAYLLLFHCFNLSPPLSLMLNGTVKIVFWAKSMGKSKTLSAFPLKHQQFPQIGDFPPFPPTFFFFFLNLDRNC